jgi:hypothetical protein
MLTRRSATVLAVFVAVRLASSVGGQGSDAGPVLAAAREALGGEARLGGVKTFVITGRTRQIRGNNLVPIEFEIDCELPDKFVRKDEFPAQDTDITVAGFRGDELIQFPQSAAGRGGPPPMVRLETVRHDFARLILGVFAGSPSSFPLTFKYLAEGDAPEGKADVLDVRGPANFTARLVVQRTTHLPVMLIWQAPAPAGRGGPPGAAPAGPPPPPAAERGGSGPTMAEHRLYYGDYRDVNATKWPFRLRHAVAGNTIEETTFDQVKVNVKIDPRKFEPPK